MNTGNSYEIHYGEVTRIDTTVGGLAKRGQIYFKSSTLTGGSEFSEPAEPAFPLAGADGEGFFFVPQVGDQIEILIDSLNEHPIPRIIRMIYSEADEPNSEFVEGFPFVQGLANRVGHIVSMSSSPDNSYLNISHVDGSALKWLKEGDVANETHTVSGTQTESFAGDVSKEYLAVVKETFKAEVLRETFGKLNEIFRDDFTSDVQGNWTQKVRGDFFFKIIKGILFEGSGGAALKIGDGKVALGTASNELLAIIEAFIVEVDKTIDETSSIAANITAITVPTAVGPSGPPANSAAFTANQTNLAAIKTSLASIKAQLTQIKGSL